MNKVFFKIIILIIGCGNVASSQINNNSNVEVLNSYFQTYSEVTDEFIVFDKVHKGLWDAEFELFEKRISDTIFQRKGTEFIILSKKEQLKLVKQIAESQRESLTKNDLPSYAKLIKFEDPGYLSALRSNNNNIVFFISKPIKISTKDKYIFFEFAMYRGQIIGTPTFQIYKKENDHYKQWSEIAFGAF